VSAARAKELDPASQIRHLTVEIGGGRPLARGYVVRGEERYFRERAILELTRAAQACGWEIARHDAHDPEFDVARLLDDLAAVPMFAAGRMVVARNAAPLFKKDGRDAAAVQRALLAFLHSRGAPGCAVVDAESLRADHAVTRAVIAIGGRSIECRRLWDSPPPWNPDPRQAELVQWLIARAREREIGLDAAAAVYLVQVTGNDLYALDAALDRVAERRARGVSDVVGWTRAASPFQTAEDLCRGDAPRALAGIEALFRAGFEERDGSRERDVDAVLAVFLGSLRGKLRQTLAGSLAFARTADLEQAAHDAGVSGNPRARREFESRVVARPAGAWRAMLDDVTDLERRTRTGGRVDENDLAVLAVRWRARARR
jgi:DNA polymerase III delta subunit